MSNGEYIEGEEEEFVDELKPGTELMLGQYKIDSFLAAGGFGITYLAKDSLDRFVVIKECFPGSFCRRQNHSVLPRSRAHQNELKSIVRMFSQEAMSLSKAGHPNIVGVHQVFEENNTAYMALDYVKGNDLLEILTDNPESLTPDLVQGYLRKMLGAIGHVHAQGILHRDISPDNIIISEAGEPVLIDFGAAREEAGGKASRMLSALRVVKDGYSPQEFYIAGSEQSPSCDLYSMAASFYHLITGELPPDSQSRLTAFAANEPDPYVPLATIGDAYPREFSTALDKAMSVLPKDRMQSADEWIAHLDGQVAETTEEIIREAVVGPARKEGKSVMPLLLGGAAVAAAAGVGFVMVSSPTAEETGDIIAEVTAPAEPADDIASAEVEAVETPAEPIEESDVAVADTETEVIEEVETVETPVANEEVTENVATASDEETQIPAAEEPIEIAETPQAPAAPEITEEDVAIADIPPVEDEPVIEVEQIAALSLPSTPPQPRPVLPEPSNIEAMTQAAELPSAIAKPTAVPVAPVLSKGIEIPREANFQLASIDRDTIPTIDIEAPAALPEPEPEPEPKFVEAPTAIETAPGGLVTADSNWSVRMPFAPSETDASVVGEVYLSAWGWLEEGVEISGVNGIAVDSIAMIPGVLRQSSVVSEQTQLEVMLSTGFNANGDLVEHQIILPVIQETVLGNGIRFETMFRNGVWQTTVSDTGAASTSLQPGDLVIEHLSTGTQMTGRTSLADAVAAANSVDLPLLVSRDGNVVEAGLLETTQPVAEPTAVATAAPEEPVTESVTEAASVNVVEASSVMERQVSGVPFTLDPNKTATVATVSEDAPFWIVPGLEIATIDGTVVGSNDQIMSLINESNSGSVQVGVKALFTEALIERPLRVGTETQTVLLNGLTFVTRTVDGASVTHVSQAPFGSNFRVGDLIVAYVGTSERLDGTISIKALLDRELAAGVTSFSFAVDRAGEVWVEAFQLASLGE